MADYQLTEWYISPTHSGGVIVAGIHRTKLTHSAIIERFRYREIVDVKGNVYQLVGEERLNTDWKRVLKEERPATYKALDSVLFLG